MLSGKNLWHLKEHHSFEQIKLFSDHRRLEGLRQPMTAPASLTQLLSHEKRTSTHY
jgi:hypothetical protein